jgi:cell division protein FtsQ
LLPKLRKDRLLWVGFILLTIIILLSAVARKKGSISEETVVEVLPLPDGSKLITEKEVKNALNKAFGNNLEGIELADLEVERIERVLEDDPFVMDANAYLDQHNEIHVRIQQREPLLRIMDNNGGNYYLDKNGAKMPTSKNYAARVLVATGNIPPHSPDFLDKKRNALKDLYVLTNRILEDEFLANFIQQIHLNSVGDFVLVPLIGDQKIILGSVNKLEAKITKLKTFYREGMPYMGWNKYKSINLKFTGQVVCKR